MSTGEGGVEFATKADIARLEDKVDDLKDQINKVLVLEERQFSQTERVARLEERTRITEASAADTKEKLSAWINRGMGAYGLLLVMFWAYEQYRNIRP